MNLMYSHIPKVSDNANPMVIEIGVMLHDLLVLDLAGWLEPAQQATDSDNASTQIQSRKGLSRKTVPLSSPESL